MSAAKKAKLDLRATGKGCDGVVPSGRHNGTVATFQAEKCNGLSADREGETSSHLNGTNLSKDAIMEMRRKIIGKSCKVHFIKKPIKIECGKGQYLFDEEGERYLDCINNVTHVGHCHPRVVKAAQEQMATLNTNNRFLYDNIITYAQRLISKLPSSLSVCYFVCTGSEANDLALRIARTHTKAKDIVILDRAYHGHSSLLIDVSPYKYNAPGGEGKKDFVHAVPTPDPYRGKHQGSPTPELGEKYALDVKEAVDSATKDGRKIAAFLVESLQGCGGQVVYPPHYFRDAFKYIREAGGVCIADEVQVGFGRVGKYFWGFESQGVVPDIVTLGKPIGNGHPLAVVVTTPELAESFAATGMTYFNTYGGNPVSCAVGNAVLDVIENENLQKHALELGGYLLTKLEELKTKHMLIGDVRGMGLFIGVELVQNRETKQPASTEATHLIYRAKEEKVLLSSDGPDNNVIKIKPPMCFTYEDAENLLCVLDKVLTEIEAASKSNN